MESTANDSEYLPSHESEGAFDESDEEEEDERPNRWRGPKSTWQQLNSQEINTLTALNEIRDRDLSVHLYNAFALKQRYKRVQNGATPDGPVPNEDINAVTGETVQPDDWLPQRSWTAWPMRAEKVPPPGDPARMGMYDPDERFTFRKPARDMPSTVLEEVISAEILKSAKEKFNARPWVQPSASDEEANTDFEEGTDDEVSDEATVKSPLSTKSKKSGSRSRSRPRSVKPELMSEGGGMGDSDEHHAEDGSHEESYKKRRFRPTVSTDDNLSYSLLRPSVRHILTKLDTTLMILHNAREATLNCFSDSGDSESDMSMRNAPSRRSSSRPGRQTPTTENKKAGKGRPLGSVSNARSRRRSSVSQTPPAQAPPDDENRDQGGKVLKKGRPKKAYTRIEGETDQEYEVRVARLQKKPLPVFSHFDSEQESSDATADSDPGRDSGNSGDGEETEGPSRRRVNKRKRVAGGATATTKDHHRSPSATSSTSIASRRGARMQTRVGLRDWRDMLGAAALAGFPVAAIDRAARRCADLFGQSMTLQTLVEGPATTITGGRKTPARVTTYVPGMPQPPLLLEEEEDEEEGERQQTPLRAATRTPSVAPPDATPESEAAAAGPSSSSQSQSQSKQARPRSRSVSRARSSRSAGSTPGGGSFLCSFHDCPRAADGEGFGRRHNLLRHLKLVHGLTASSEGGGGSGGGVGGDDQSVAGSVSSPMMMPEEVDSEDEMYGAVHVDWFLKPVKLQQGWRGADTEETKKRWAGHWRARGRPRSQVRGSEKGVADEDGDDDGDDGDIRMGEDD